MMERSMAPLPSFDDGGAASRGLAREIGFNRRQMEGYTRPPPASTFTPDFDFAAGPGPTFTPPSLTPDIRGRPEYPGSMPAAPPPLATAADDPYRAPSSFDASRPMNGGGGSDVLAAGNASPLPLPPSPFRYDPLSSIHLPPAVPESYDPLSSIRVPPVAEIPIPAAAGRTIVNPNEYFNPGVTDVQSDAQKDGDTVPAPPLPTAANAGVVAPEQQVAKTASESRRTGGARSSLGPIGRILTAPLAPFIGGRNGGGFLGPNGFLGGMGTPPAFTAMSSGTAPYGNQGGTTNWQRGTSTAFGGGNAVSGPTQALSWQDSNGRTITAHTDPWSGTTFHSFS
jgi:hypothetical protein